MDDTERVNPEVRITQVSGGFNRVFDRVGKRMNRNLSLEVLQVCACGDDRLELAPTIAQSDVFGSSFSANLKSSTMIAGNI